MVPTTKNQTPNGKKREEDPPTPELALRDQDTQEGPRGSKIQGQDVQRAVHGRTREAKEGPRKNTGRRGGTKEGTKRTQSLTRRGPTKTTIQTSQRHPRGRREKEIGTHSTEKKIP